VWHKHILVVGLTSAYRQQSGVPEDEHLLVGSKQVGAVAGLAGLNWQVEHAVKSGVHLHIGFEFASIPAYEQQELPLHAPVAS